MSDPRQSLVTSIERSLIAITNPDTVNTIMQKIICILGDYEVSKRCTELVEYDDTNTRILKTYCANLIVEGKSKHTIYRYKRLLDRFLEEIWKPVTEISVYDVRYFLACEKERGLSERTLENERSYISSFFSWCSTEEIIPKNPCATLKPFKVPEKELKAFSPVDMDALRHSCVNLKERAIVEMLVSSGVRVTELSNMNVSDVDFDSMTVKVRHGKGGKDRTTYISEVAKLHIQRYLFNRAEDGEALFYNKDHERLQSGGIRRIVDVLGKRAGVDHVHPHRFRRTLATSLAAKGMPIQEIQSLLGHSNINTTMRYICMDDRQVRASYQKHIA